MEETIKISLGGIAFSFNRDAYEALNNYLEDLNKHYSAKIEGKEILSDIEDRIAELLLEKQEVSDFVTIDRVKEIIEIMGQPSDIEDNKEEPENDDLKQETSSHLSTPKRYYRDLENRKIAGVCSGLGHYFKTDPILFRIIFVLLSGTLFFVHELNIWWGAILAYIVLWIVTPGAKTVKQRCAMMGERVGIKGVEDSYNSSVRPSTSALGGIIKVGFGVLLIIIGLFLFITSWTVLFITEDFIGTPLTFLIDYVDLPASSLSLWLAKISPFLLLMLPSFILLYEGIKLTFGFRSPSWRPGLIAFILWIITLIVTIAFGIRSFAHLAIDEGFSYSNEITKTTLPMKKYYDTLYVKFEPLPKVRNGEELEWIKVRENDNLYYAKTSEEGIIYAIYPDYHKRRVQSVVLDTLSKDILRKDTTILPEIKIKENYIYRKIKSEERVTEPVVVKDSLVVLNPQIITKKSRFSGSFYNVTLMAPDSSVVLVN